MKMELTGGNRTVPSILSHQFRLRHVRPSTRRCSLRWSPVPNDDDVISQARTFSRLFLFHVPPSLLVISITLSTVLMPPRSPLPLLSCSTEVKSSRSFKLPDKITLQGFSRTDGAPHHHCEVVKAAMGLVSSRWVG